MYLIRYFNFFFVYHQYFVDSKNPVVSPLAACFFGPKNSLQFDLRLDRGYDTSQPDSFGTPRFIEVQQSAWQPLRRLPGQRDPEPKMWGNWEKTNEGLRRLDQKVDRLAILYKFGRFCTGVEGEIFCHCLDNIG